MTQRTLPSGSNRGIRASSEDRSTALLRASLEKRNAKLADTVGRQAKEIVRLRDALVRAHARIEDAAGHSAVGDEKSAWESLAEAGEDIETTLTEIAP